MSRLALSRLVIFIAVALDLTLTRSRKNLAFDAFYWPQETEIWTALADLEAGLTNPSSWPDEDFEPPSTEQSDLLSLQIRHLNAYRLYLGGRKVQALPLLAAVCMDLEHASKRRSDAIIPFVLAAYHYGFAAREAGLDDEARKALEKAYQKYPYGSHAADARKYLGL